MNSIPWYASSDEVQAFARDGVASGYFETVEALLEYFEKPWHWADEYVWWNRAGRPDDAESWEAAADNGFEDDDETAAFTAGDVAYDAAVEQEIADRENDDEALGLKG